MTERDRLDYGSLSEISPADRLWVIGELVADGNYDAARIEISQLYRDASVLAVREDGLTPGAPCDPREFASAWADGLRTAAHLDANGVDVLGLLVRLRGYPGGVVRPVAAKRGPFGVLLREDGREWMFPLRNLIVCDPRHGQCENEPLPKATAADLAIEGLAHALTVATDTGALDRIAAEARPDQVNAFCDAVAALKGGIPGHKCLECDAPLGRSHATSCGKRVVGHPSVVRDDCREPDV